jgi:hypothetical protein
MTLEEICRRLIEQGIADEIIDIRPDYSRSVFSPNDLTATIYLTHHARGVHYE